MSNSCHPLSPLKVNSYLSRSAIVGVLSTVGLLAGVVPQLSGHSPMPMFSAAAYAQDDDAVRFARAVYEIEPRRVSVSNEVKKITGSVPDIACNQPQRLNSFPPNVRSLIVDFCNFSRQTIEKNGLTVDRFNEIMMQRENNPTIRGRIDAEVRRLQGGGSP
jgi:Domain of unknown function (DUF4168)